MYICAFLALGSSRAFAQTTIWVDSAQTTPPGTGTSTDPYKSLTYALTAHPGIGPGWTVMVAGNGLSDPYTTDSLAGANATETFPIAVPNGILLVYWDKLGLLPSVKPASAIFLPGDSLANTCFTFEGGPPVNETQGISAYLQTTQTPWPNRNQGFEVHDFEKAFSIDDDPLNTAQLDVLLDGVSTFDCQQSIIVKKDHDGTFNVLVKRSALRSPSSGSMFQPNLQVVEIVFDDSSGIAPFTPIIEIRNCDFRPDGVNLESSMITVLNTGGSDDYLHVLVKNCYITGQPLVEPIPPNPVSKILGACIEAVWAGNARGRVTVQDCKLWDAEGDGILGSVQGGGDALGEIEVLGCDVAYHGSQATGINPVIAVGTFSDSGIHLAAIEKGDWLDVEFNDTETRDNYRHGVFLELSSNNDEDDGFRNVDVDYCNFSRNGLALGADEEGHGFYVELHEATINVEIHRSLLSRNHTTGFNAFLDRGDTTRHQVIAVTNTVISANEGISFADPGHPWPVALPRHIAPFTVESVEGDHTATVNLSHVTFTNCVAPFAVSMFDWEDTTFGFTHQQLWSDASSIDNCVLKSNYWPATTHLSDQAFYPEPPDPSSPPPGGHLWIRRFDSTSYSNLGNYNPVWSAAYVPVRNNFYTDPQLTAYTWMNTSLGLVFPQGTSPLVDVGGGTVFASESTDVRGSGYPRIVDYGNNGSPIRDIGAFELQN